MEIVVGGGGEKLYSQNLGDFLRIKEEDHWRNNLNQSTPSSSGGGRRVSSGLTLNAILTGEKIGQSPPSDAPQRRVEPNRTLLDIIRDDQTSGVGRGREDGRKSWLLNKIRLRRRGGRSAWPDTVTTSSSAVNNNSHHRTMIAAATRPHSDRFSSNINSDESTQPSSRTPAPLSNPRPSTESGRFEPMLQSTQLITDESNSHQDRNEEPRSDAVEAAAEVGVSPEQPAVRMSLMALLAENDRQMGLESSAYKTDEVGFESEVGVEKEAATSSAASATGLEYNNCCVCMVRHKGAAFIPCGHTFCRLCSRELWMQRGNCPLCNNFIREILDIF